MKKLFYIISFTAIAVLLSFCGSSKSESMGTEIPKDSKVVKLADVLAAPDDFHDQNVVMEGIVSGQCASLCEFMYKEGAEVVEIFPKGFTLPKLKIGSKVRMYAQITSGSERVVVSALGLERL
ncbi:MAG: hypothetical protein ACOCW1_03615 [Chitinispirillaceae bacterium]